MGNTSQSDNYYVDPRIVGKLVQKLKIRNKLFTRLLIIGVVAFICLLIFSFITISKNNRYGKYISEKIDTNIDTIVLETVKSKYILDQTTQQLTFSTWTDLLQSTALLKHTYRDTKNIMYTAMNTVSPDKLIQVTTQFEEFIYTLMPKESNNTISLNPEQMDTLNKYKSYYNEMLFIQYQAIADPTSTITENNLYLFQLDATNVTTVENSFKEKYTRSFTHTLENDGWTAIFIKGETTVIKLNILT